MQQKTTYRAYLVIGISLLNILGLSQCEVRDETLKTATYIYKNESGENLMFYLRSESYNLSEDTFSINDGDSLLLVINSRLGLPLMGNYTNSEITDSVGIKFESNKCLSYTRDAQSGVFDQPKYLNYTKELVLQDEFTLIYVFDLNELNRAIDCN